jgi:hypothetical protein
MTSNLLSMVILVVMLSGCGASMPVEPPLCVPIRDFVLEPLSVEQQLAIKRLSPSLLGQVAGNDVSLKGHIRLLEAVIRAHDEPLDNCD